MARRTIDQLVGRKLGPYVLQAAIGAGGMGAVYRANHELLDQVRAVKVMSSHLAHHQSFVRLFHREAMLAARLRHPNIVQIYDVAQQDDLHYIVMEHLTGSSLRAIVKGSSPIPFERAIHLLRQLAEALDFAHSQHVSHRDVKPANIFVDESDRLTLVDFGIARAAETFLCLRQLGCEQQRVARERALGVGQPFHGRVVVAQQMRAAQLGHDARVVRVLAQQHQQRVARAFGQARRA